MRIQHNIAAMNSYRNYNNNKINQKLKRFHQPITKQLQLQLKLKMKLHKYYILNQEKKQIFRDVFIFSYFFMR